MTEICMPSLGADMESGTLIEWTVRVGDAVTRGSIVALVETQKATMEIESFVAGRIEALLVEPGAKVPVGAPIARVAPADVHAAAVSPITTESTRTTDIAVIAPSLPALALPRIDNGGVAPVSPGRAAVTTSPIVIEAPLLKDAAAIAPATRTDIPISGPSNAVASAGRPAISAPRGRETTSTAAPSAVRTGAPAFGPRTAISSASTVLVAGTRTRSSPAARKLARELAIDLRTVAPSGPHGAIVLRDVERAARAPAPAPRRVPPATGSVRDAIASAMARSKREIPHYYLSHVISVEAALEALAAINAARPIADRILPPALLLHAVTRALWEVPELNGFFVDGAYRSSEAVHLGTAIALRTGGVIAPAIVDADQKSRDELMAALRDLVARARAGRLRASELTCATITVTSLGDRGCDAVWGVINPPQVAIVGFGAIVERPWSSGGQIRSHRVVTVTLSADHRVTDGHRGGRFLAAIDRILQEPITP